MSTIVIKVDGTDITDDVMIADASFSSQVNGSVGQATLRVKDPAQTYEFNSGDSLTLDVDGERVWGGYVMQAKKIYALPVIQATPPGSVTRVWQIMGLDYNVLFNKRIVFKESDPTGKLAFEYSVDTYDDTIINDIFDNYLDISGDGLTRGGVTRIAKATLDLPGQSQKGLLASAGFTWKQMMDSVQRATGGVYYISPTKVLTYVDAETTTSSYTLTDEPTGGFDVGYQKFTFLADGTNLVNDMLLWGAGTGSTSYVFSRSEDSSSITDHGRWQLGLVTSGLYRQTSADVIADSYVYGTPQSHRGGKDDARAFNVRVFQPRFLAGDIVDIECGIFAYTETLPVRKMTVTFVNPTEAIFDLTLTHAIDQGLGLYEYLALRVPGFHIPDIDIPPPSPPSGPPTCTDAVCGITDGFERTESGTWDVATCQVPWFTDPFQTGGTISVDGNAGIIFLDDPTQPRHMLLGGTGAFLTEEPVDLSVKTMRFQLPDYVSALNNAYNLRWSPTDHPGLTIGPNIGIGFIDAGITTNSYISYGVFGGGDVAIPKTFWSSSSTYTWTVAKTVSGMTQSITDGTNTYTLTHGSAPTLAQCSIFFDIVGSSSPDITLRITEIIIPEITRCTAVQFENFYRTSGPDDWGNSTPSGHVWSDSDTGPISVSYGAGLMSIVGTNNAQVVQLSPPIYLITGGTRTMHARFRINPVVNSPDRPNELYFDLWNSGATLLVIPSTDPDDGMMILFDNTVGPVADTSFTDWEDNAEYDVRWEQTWQGTGKAKIWRTGDPEPDWMLEADTTTAFTNDYFGIRYTGGNDVDSDVTFSFIEFDYADKPCYFSGPGPVSIPASSGKVCETLVHSGGTDFTASRAFFSGTLETWVNGVAQTDVTSVGSAATFSLSGSIDASDVLRICYRANGDPV